MQFEVKHKCVSKTQTDHAGVGNYNYVRPRRPLFQAIAIMQGVQKSRLTTNIWSITAGSKLPSTLARYAADCVDQRRVIHKRHSTTHEWSGVCHRWYCRNAKKNAAYFCLYWTPLGGYRPQKGRKRIRDTYVPSCKISFHADRYNRRWDICTQTQRTATEQTKWSAILTFVV